VPRVHSGIPTSRRLVFFGRVPGQASVQRHKRPALHISSLLAAATQTSLRRACLTLFALAHWYFVGDAGHLRTRTAVSTSLALANVTTLLQLFFCVAPLQLPRNWSCETADSVPFPLSLHGKAGRPLKSTTIPTLPVRYKQYEYFANQKRPVRCDSCDTRWKEIGRHTTGRRHCVNFFSPAVLWHNPGTFQARWRILSKHKRVSELADPNFYPANTPPPFLRHQRDPPLAMVLDMCHFITFDCGPRRSHIFCKAHSAHFASTP
jgi:hypothetical protein